jgi:signal transduction histidine kinase
VSAAVALLLGGLMLRTGGVLALAGAAVGATVAAIDAWRRSRQAATLLFSAIMVVFAVGQFSGIRRARALAASGEAERAAIERRATAALAAQLTSEADRLRRLAVAALDVPAEPAAAFDRLDELRDGTPYRAVALVRGGALAAWAGHYLGPLDSLEGPVGVAASDFYLVLYAVAGRDRDRAVAASLIHAARPADQLAPTLEREVGGASDVAGFTYALPDARMASSDTVGLVRAAGVPVLRVGAVALATAQVQQRLLEQGRERGVELLALALMLFAGVMWRAGGLVRRFGALGVTLAVVAVVPLADLSNRTALFNPAFFFMSAGGPFTGSIGALVLTAATALLGVLAAQRAGLVPRSRWAAAAIVVAVAVTGPFLLGAIAKGIRFPPNGAPVVLWLAWETTVFVTALAILYAAMVAGDRAMGLRRGVPPWLAPVLAAAATSVAPLVVEPRGGLPAWYTILWIGAAVVLAFTRPGRATLWSAATVAAFGSTALVWSETVKARVRLAEQDVGSLSQPDPAALALVSRFPSVLDSSSAPRTRVELLARFAVSDLAKSDLPVDVTTWTAAGHVIADLRVGMAPGTAQGVAYFAREAAETMRPVLTNAPGEPGIHTVLAYPHADRSVTTVLVAPRTRLVTPDPFPVLSGLARTSDVGGDPPYLLQPAPAAQSPYISTEAQWTRRNAELHGDWFLPPLGGPILHVHARVPLESFGALTTRAVLMVCVNLALLGVLLLMLVVADGGVATWVRERGLPWLRSYRARLSISLFAAFLVPTAAFAAWSYRRLQNEDAETRELLVQETLRGVTAASGIGLDSLAVRFQTPLLLYANGALIATSDPVLDALAPIGRLLPSAAARALLEDDDGFTTAELTVGTQPMRFGFRQVADTSSSASLVLAAPGRMAEPALDPRRRDLAFFVLFAAVAGALGALWLSGVAGRAFARPIGELREGALALSAGEREPQLRGDPPLEFQPVFHAFRQMARDLEAGRARDARAQRVLAWGEMARQVAHEIKNPLTPMRLGVQHLMRARNDPRVDFRQVFDENAERLLAEIDRLDEIARAFSRYGTAPDAQPAPEAVDVAEAVRDVVRLERLGGDGVTWEMDGTDAPVLAMARATELREVLLNLLENSRLAGARRVRIRVTTTGGRVVVEVTDDGHGIAADALPRIFEPHFSTRTSGSGLGLAISRRLIDGWGGSISVTSEPGAGATVTISLVPAPAV